MGVDRFGLEIDRTAAGMIESVSFANALVTVTLQRHRRVHHAREALLIRTSSGARPMPHGEKVTMMLPQITAIAISAAR
jgi:hypothetical protein